MKKIFFLLIFFAGVYQMYAQKYTISGYVEDATTGERLISANVYETEKMSGTVTNFYGFYSLTLQAGKVNIKYSFVGYQPVEKQIELDKDTIITVTLTPSLELAEVTVTDNRNEQKIRSTQISINEVPVKTIKNLPVLLGETDVLKTIQLLPGVQSGTEGTSGLYIRGGGPDQNLILLDGVPVYNVSHLFGFFSVFNADAIQSIKLIKGGFPARYGGRLSSVLDIRMKEGNNKERKISGSIGLISSRLTFESPIIKDRTSVIVSARRTYVDVLAWPIINIIKKMEDYEKLRAGYFFHDVNAKINHKFSDRSRLFVSTYLGQDKAYYNEEYKWETDYYHDKFSLRWGNITTALRWNYMFNNKLFSNTTLTYSRYRFEIKEEYNDNYQQSNYEWTFGYFSGITDYAASIDFDYYPTPDHSIKFGGKAIRHTFKPGMNYERYKESTTVEDVDTTFGNDNIHATELAFFAEDDINIGDYVKTNLGVHYSSFFVEGREYHSLQPRVSARVLLSKDWSVKAAYTHMYQYIHLLTNSTVGLPTDLWLPSTDSIKPEKSTQFAIGTVYAINKDINVSVEGFYKTMDNLIEYKEGASFIVEGEREWEDKIEIGKGWSYGIELLIEKQYGNTTGWIGYTWSKSERQFDNISFGKRFPYKYDRRHDISFVITHKFNERIDAGLTWVFGTGNAVTLPHEQYVSLFDTKHFGQYEESDFFWGNMVEHHEKRNNDRMPAYHRLDISVNFHKQKKWGERIWTVGIYNVYSRQNPFYLMFGYDYNYRTGESRKVLKQLSLFPIIPSISYKFRF